MKCEECKYWLALFTEHGTKPMMSVAIPKDQMGWCRRHSPISENEDEFHNYRWPHTSENDCCGEFEPKLSEIEKLEKSRQQWRSSCWAADRRTREQIAKNRQFRAWLLRVALPLNGCKKSSTTAKLQKVIECKLKCDPAIPRGEEMTKQAQ